MTSAPTAPAVRRVPVGVVLGIAVAWAVAIGVSAAGHSELLHHDVLARGQDAAMEHHHGHGDRVLPLVAAVAVVLVGWQVMVAAMMLPSTVPLLRLFAHTSARQERPHAALGAFVAGYAVVWAIFGAIAVAGDLALHRLVDGRPGVEERLLPGVVLLLAGAFQFTDLKDRCLQQCRHPALWMLRHYRRGVASAFDLGRRHGVFCLGCCWALMLLMFAAGVANLLWMAALAALMAYEKIGRHGERVARVAGVGLVVWGIVVLADGAWLPAGS